MIKKEIDNHYNNRERKEFKRDEKFHVSESNKCARALFFEYKGYPREEIGKSTFRKFVVGNLIHRNIMRELLSLSSDDLHVISSEINIPPNDLITGRADVIVSLNNELHVVDIKSINDYAFKLLKDGSREPDEGYVKQLNLYMHFFGIKKGFLLFDNKNTQELLEVPVPYNEALALECIERFKRIKEMIDKNIMPKKPQFSEDDKWKCDYCAYKNECEKIEAGKTRTEEAGTGTQA